MKKQFLAIDLGGTFMKFGIIDSEGMILETGKVPTPRDWESAVIEIEALIEKHRTAISGVGISAPGKVDIKTGTIYNGGNLTFLHKRSFKEVIEAKYDLPCFVVNDGKSAVLAEKWLGNFQGVTNGATIILGTGIGGGLLLNGELFDGVRYQAAEFSFIFATHAPESDDDIFARENSAVGFVTEGAEILGLAEADGVQVFAAIKDGSNAALTQHFESYCRRIATFIINVQTMLDIEVALIGGGISAQAVLVDEINHQYRKIRKDIELMGTLFEEIDIKACKFSNDSNLLGAVSTLAAE
ncbi:MAG: ROK family protein [Turicibacter sp.]|nr:ROK family protein [Turicibacter sp.]